MFFNQDLRYPWIRDILAGIVITSPVLVVYIAIGIAFGVLAVDNGITPFNAILMSLLVYAGTAQIVGVQLIAIGASPISIILTAIIINARFFVMSSAIAPHLSKFHFWERLVYGVQMTDATFAIHVNRVATTVPRKLEIFTINFIGHFVWVLSSIAGVILGSTTYDLEGFGIDYAMPAMFIGLLVPLIIDRTQLVVAAVAGSGTILFYSLGLSFWTTLAATILGVLTGFGIQTWTKN